MGPQTTPRTSPASRWAGRALSGLCVLFFLFDAVIHIAKPKPVLEASASLGFPSSLWVALGSIVLVCVVLYVVPRTAVLGAILLTGYLGGAVAANVRVLHPAGQIAFPVVFGILLWGGLYLRDGRVRALIPVRR
jgi:hypothetical protein